MTQYVEPEDFDQWFRRSLTGNSEDRSMSAPVLVKLPKVETSQNVVDILEDLLEKAKAGEIHSLATAVVYQSEDTQTWWATGPNLRGGIMLSALVMLKRDWEDRMLEKRIE